MIETITVITQKGGVGKTSTAAAIGAGLMKQGKRVLFVDLDPQSNLSVCLKADTDGLTVYELLMRKAKPQAVIQKTTEGDVIAASPSLSGMDIMLNMVGKEYRLKEALQPLSGLYDYTVIDTPPALGVLTVNALTASTSVIIPAHADLFSLQGIHQLFTTIDTVRHYCNPGLTVKGVVLTQYSPRATLKREMRESITETAEQYGTRVFDTYIRENVSISEAQAMQMNIFDYAPKSNGAADYAALVDEITKRR